MVQHIGAMAERQNDQASARIALEAKRCHEEVAAADKAKPSKKKREAWLSRTAAAKWVS